MKKQVWLIAVMPAFLAGLAAFGIFSAKAHSYLLDDPTACANCHVMQKQYSGYIASPHRNVAVCNDCHTPAGYIPRYITKGLNGISHSFAFTTGLFEEPIYIKKRNRTLAETACLKCHNEIFTGHAGSTEAGGCLTCHRGTGH